MKRMLNTFEALKINITKSYFTLIKSEEKKACHDAVYRLRGFGITQVSILALPFYGLNEDNIFLLGLL